MRQSIKELYRGVGGEDGLGMRLDQAVDKMAFEDWLLVHRPVKFKLDKTIQLTLLPIK